MAEFGAEMAEQRFALIVTDPLPLYWKNPDNVYLAMENNVVNEKFVPLILCAYELKESLVDGRLDIFVPKSVKYLWD